MRANKYGAIKFPFLRLKQCLKKQKNAITRDFENCFLLSAKVKSRGGKNSIESLLVKHETLAYPVRS